MNETARRYRDKKPNYLDTKARLLRAIYRRYVNYPLRYTRPLVTFTYHPTQSTRDECLATMLRESRIARNVFTSGNVQESDER